MLEEPSDAITQEELDAAIKWRAQDIFQARQTLANNNNSIPNPSKDFAKNTEEYLKAVCNTHVEEQHVIVEGYRNSKGGA